jgi:hypothetical protein
LPDATYLDSIGGDGSDIGAYGAQIAQTAPPALDVDEETGGAGSSVPVGVRVSSVGNETR